MKRATIRCQYAGNLDHGALNVRHMFEKCARHDKVHFSICERHVTRYVRYAGLVRDPINREFVWRYVHSDDSELCSGW